MKEHHRPRILLVEDDEVFAQMYEIRFKTEDFDFERVRDGKEALQEVSLFKPDLILLDIVMPEMNGIEVLKYLRSQKETKDIPVFLLTALSQTKDKTAGLEAGASDYIVKSEILPHEVVERVKDSLKIDSIAKDK